MARSIFPGLRPGNLLILASIGLAATLAAGCEYSSPRRAISASAMSAGNDIVPARWAQRVYESNCAVSGALQNEALIDGTLECTEIPISLHSITASWA